MKTKLLALSTFLACTLVLLSVSGKLIAQFEQSQNSQTEVVSGFELPFFEDWNSGSFETNQWETFDVNWQIDTLTGNDAPSAKFSSLPLLSNYSAPLVSYSFNGDSILDGSVKLKFDLKLEDDAECGTEKLLIKINDGTNWIILDSIINLGSFTWTSYEYDISYWAIGNEFSISFDASGVESTDIVGWYIDNIEIFRKCDKPRWLRGDNVWFSNDDWGGEISWRAPSSALPVGTWVHWDDGINSTGIGLTDGGNFFAAIRYDEGMLDGFAGAPIRSIQYFPYESGYDYFVINIWEGEDATNLIYSDTAFNTIAGEWNEHLLTESIVIEQSLEYWVGYEVVGSIAGSFPAGCDDGPAVAGYGDMVKTSEAGEWETLSGIGLDYNWNIQLFLGNDPTQDPEDLIGFNVLRKIEGEPEYIQFDFVPFIVGQPTYESYDMRPDLQGISGAYYKVNSLWIIDGDTCNSRFARSWEAYEDDFVYIHYTTSTNENEFKDELMVYPNPTSSTLNIVSKSSIKSTTIVNYMGQKVFESKGVSNERVTIDVSGFDIGMYILLVETEDDVLYQKFIKK